MNIFFLTACSVISGIEAALFLYWIVTIAGVTIAYPLIHFLYFYTFIVFAIIFYFLIRFILNRRSFSKEILECIHMFVAVQVVGIVLIAGALFKTIIYDYRAGLAWSFFYLFMPVLLLINILWFWCYQMVTQWFKGIINTYKTQWVWLRIFDIFLIAMIGGIVYIPDIRAMVAHIFMGEHFHHMDSFLSSQAWTVFSGGTINVDIISRYSFGLAYVTAFWSKIMGGMTYERIFAFVVGLAVIYYMFVFIVLRCWFRSVGLTVACWAIIFKEQMFYGLSFPFIFTYPQATVARNFLDIFCLFLLWAYCRWQQKRFLLAAALVCGFAIWYFVSTGFYLTIAFISFLVLLWINPRQRKISIVEILGLSGIVLGLAMGLFVLSAGSHVFTLVFWDHLTSFIRIFMMLYGAPLLDTLRFGQFTDFMMAVLIPLGYVLSIVFIVIFWLRGKNRPMDLLVVFLSIYGLGQLEHFMVMSFGNSYYSKTLPFFFVMFYWIQKWMQALNDAWRFRGEFLLAISMVAALLTTHGFTSYPNCFNFSKNPLVDPLVARPLPDGSPYLNHKFRGFGEDRRFSVNSLGEVDEGIRTELQFSTHAQLIKRYQADTDLNQDVALIQSLTKEGQKVPLLSSFDVMILMKANRAPFFLEFPFFDNRPLKMRFFPIDLLLAKQNLLLILKQLENQKPMYIFMEKIMLNQNYPTRYERDTPGLLGVLHYVWANYAPVQSGQYLIAMKRKELLK